MGSTGVCVGQVTQHHSVVDVEVKEKDVVCRPCRRAAAVLLRALLGLLSSY